MVVSENGMIKVSKHDYDQKDARLRWYEHELSVKRRENSELQNEVNIYKKNIADGRKRIPVRMRVSGSGKWINFTYNDVLIHKMKFMRHEELQSYGYGAYGYEDWFYENGRIFVTKIHDDGKRRDVSHPIGKEIVKKIEKLIL